MCEVSPNAVQTVNADIHILDFYVFGFPCIRPKNNASHRIVRYRKSEPSQRPPLAGYRQIQQEMWVYTSHVQGNWQSCGGYSYRLNDPEGVLVLIDRTPAEEQAIVLYCIVFRAILVSWPNEHKETKEPKEHPRLPILHFCSSTARSPKFGEHRTCEGCEVFFFVRRPYGALEG